MENIDSELNDNLDEIERCEQEIDKLEAEIKILKQKGPTSRMEVLKKQLKVSELEGDILALQDENDRKSMKAIKSDLKSRKSSRDPEYDLLGICYKRKNDLDIWKNELEGLEIKYRILQQSGSKDAKAYSEIRSQIETTKQTIETCEKRYEEGKQKFSEIYNKDIDFSKSFTDLFYEYGNKNAPVRHPDDISELRDSLSDQYYSFIDNEREDDETKKYKEDTEKQVSSIFTDGLDGTSKELAQVFSELYMDEIDFFGIEKNINQELLGENPGVLSKVIKSDKGYVVIYENGDGNKVGIKCSRNTQTGKIEIQGKLPKEDKSLDGLEYGEESANDGNSISREQMEMQVVKKNIEESMQGKKISEIKEVTDPKIVEYLNAQNNLQNYSFLNTPTKVYMISTQDKDGNTSYEFVAHDSRNSYTKLSGMQQVETTRSHIATEKYSVNGMKCMQPVECQFVDKGGNSYYVTHPFGNMPMELSVEEVQEKDNSVSTIETQDFGLNGLFHKTRVKELLRAGYNAMSIGIEKVKSVYKKYRSKEQEQENNIHERGE